MRVDEVLVAPITTEKSLATPGKYSFVTHRTATADKVKEALERYYGLKASDIVKLNKSVVPPKLRFSRKGGKTIKRPAYRKVTVTLSKGKVLDFNAFK